MAGLYVHVPFCHSKCYYCDFYSKPCRGEDEMRVYIDCIKKEYDLRKEEIGEKISTIYLGGGTPSILPPDILAHFIDHVGGSQGGEFTIEANPEDVTPQKAAAWIGMGINRVSMGVQSFIDTELKAVGRRHRAEDAANAFHTLRNAGVKNICLDLIYGLPGQSLESFGLSLKRLLDLRPEHFSAYMLSYEHGTRLTAMRNKREIRETSEDVLVDMYTTLCNQAADAGYRHYEISNFCLPGKEAVHNSNYWDGTPYLGLGPGAHSFDGKTRRFNPLSLKIYTEKIKSNALACEYDEENDCNRFNDMLMTALRTSVGLDLCRVPPERKNELMRDAHRLIQAGSLKLTDNRLVIPEPAWLVSDDTIATLMQTD